MTNKVFHLFPNLPWELRHMIWEAAIHPMAPGIHTFSFITKEEKEKTGTIQKTLPSCYEINNSGYLAAIPKLNDDGTPNSSAYLWDAGLWTACKESREAIISYLDMTHWHQKKRQSIEEDIDFDDRSSPTFKKYANISTITRAPSIKDGGEDWHLVVRPYQDAIKPTLETIYNWLDPSGYGYCTNWLCLLDDFAFCAEYHSFGLIRNVIVEFDSSWLLNWPTTSYFDDEISLRYFVYRMVSDFANELSECFIWLIDRGEYEVEPYKLVDGEPYVFYDCNEEYVQVESKLGFAGRRETSAAYFIDQLDYFGEFSWRDRWEADVYATSLDRWNTYTWQQVGVLRPRKLADTLLDGMA